MSLISRAIESSPRDVTQCMLADMTADAPLLRMLKRLYDEANPPRRRVKDSLSHVYEGNVVRRYSRGVSDVIVAGLVMS